jgi:hypothetical protein
MSEATVTKIVIHKSEYAALFEGSQLSGRVSQWITEYYGERCPDKCEHCPCCEKWAEFDKLFEDVKDL